MTVKEFYDFIGGGYEEMFGKFRSDERIVRFLGMFQRDQSFAQLKEALNNDDCQQAFVAAHTLKGVSMNLCLHDVITQAVSITEALRAENILLAKQLFPDVEAVYNKTIEALASL